MCGAPAWCRKTAARVLIVACVFGALQVLVGNHVLASHCGSYVIAIPMTGDGTKHIDAQVDTKSAPHVPTPCERGQCRQAPFSPLAPPTVPTVRTTDHLLLTVFAAIEL